MNLSLSPSEDFASALQTVFNDQEVTEILLNGPQTIFAEKRGTLFDCGISMDPLQYSQLIERIYFECGLHTNQEKPFAEGIYRSFRLTGVDSAISGDFPVISLRRKPRSDWTLEGLEKAGWCSSQESSFLLNLIHDRKNLLIVGPTGSGKTTVMSSLMKEIPATERCVILEDVSELEAPNGASSKLLSRSEGQGMLPEISLTQLLKRSLRLRPDRLILGEARGGEAKDLLMALATGHSGSMASLHADDGQQALMRLEMMIQMGAPQWSLESIRKLSYLTIPYIVVAGKETGGHRHLKEIRKVCSVESHGFTTEIVEF